MTKNLLFIFSFLLLSLEIFAQNNIQFNIHHRLNDDGFEFNKTANNNINTPFQITRLEYYISEISLIHDGGQETFIDDLYVLVNAEFPTQVDLGDHNINFVEKIAFHIGVDSAHNNSDPSVYKVGHPLALKLPSMHWGWAAGYNFIALEGVGGSAFNKAFQIHSLGNGNYLRYEIEQNVGPVNGHIELNIDGDYARALEDLDAGIGIFYHGTTKQAKKLIDNFHDHVFSASENTASVKKGTEKFAFSIFPNPVINNEISISLVGDKTEYGLIIDDAMGKRISRLDKINHTGPINLNLAIPGLYFLSLTKEGQVIATKKIIIQL